MYYYVLNIYTYKIISTAIYKVLRKKAPRGW